MQGVGGKVRPFVFGIGGGLAACIICAPNSVHAQAAPLTSGPAISLAGVTDPNVPQAQASRFYGGIEYLHWWAKNAPLAVPLLGTGPDTATVGGGILNYPDAKVVYGAPFPTAAGGNDSQSLPGLSGGRLTLGYWLDDSRRYAVELQGIAFQSVTGTFTARGSGDSPSMRIPLYNSVPYRMGGVGEVVLPSEDGVPVSINGDLAGGVTFKNSLQLWGAQANGVASLYRGASWELSGVGGFRYLNLSEGFNLNLDIEGLADTPFASESGWASDQFRTRNRFYGATLGLRGRYMWGPLSLELTGLLSMGANNSTLDVAGYFQDFNTPLVTPVPRVVAGQRPVAQGPNGVFAQPSNEGSSSGSRFALVPEVSIKLAYDITPAISLTIGYDFLYESSVLRPTDQIDRNFSKGLPFQQDPNSTTGPTRRFKTTDFYAQGVSLGVVYRF